MNTDMLIMVYALLIVVTIILYVPFIWRSSLRRIIAGGLAVLSGFLAGTALLLNPSGLYIPLAATQLYIAFNCIRIVENRMNGHYMMRATARTFGVVAAMQVMYGMAWWILSPLNNTVILAGVATTQAVCALVFFILARRRIAGSAFRYLGDATHNASPTVTVAIPARDESKDLQECLQSLLKTDYPKLEILVLDDCSHGPRTAEIIRSFAHDGVRFLQGEPVKDYWLAKNQAYDVLADNANGEIILFCGVDTRFEPQTLQLLINQFVISKQRMLSVMPQRLGQPHEWAPAQFSRYFRELVYPQRILGRPPVLSTCFLIYRDDIEKFGGFNAVRRTINPEGYFAKQLQKTMEYSFIRGNVALGLHSVKSIAGQYRTAIRTQYPQAQKRPEVVILLSIAVLFFIHAPLILVVLAALRIVPPYIGGIALFSLLVWCTTYLQVVRATSVNTSARALLCSPLIPLYDVALLHTSMFRYELSEVVWKGRNVCEPVMHVLPHLPPLDAAPHVSNQGAERRS
jgi:Glycosyl transferase family 2